MIVDGNGERKTGGRAREDGPLEVEEQKNGCR